MTTERDPQTRLVLSWLREDLHENADRVLVNALDEVDATPQRRSGWPAWRPNQMNLYAKLLAGAAGVLVVAFVGYQLLPRSGGPGGQSTIAPSPTTPALIARGTFNFVEGEIELIASRAGDGVTGTMTMSHTTGNFTVDWKCTRTTQDGVILLAGDVTESASPYAPKGEREVLALKRGTPVLAGLDNEGREGSGLTRAATCEELLEQVIDPATHSYVAGPLGLEPIGAGSVEFGP